MAKDKLWNGFGWYDFIGSTTSTTDIGLISHVCYMKFDFWHIFHKL